jgi:hypothetical protein
MIQHHPVPWTSLYPVKDIVKVHFGPAVPGLIVGDYHESPVLIKPQLNFRLVSVGTDADHIGDLAGTRNMIRIVSGRARHGKAPQSRHYYRSRHVESSPYLGIFSHIFAPVSRGKIASLKEKIAPRKLALTFASCLVRRSIQLTVPNRGSGRAVALWVCV